MLGVKPELVEGRSLAQLQSGGWNSPKLANLFKEIFNSQCERASIEIEVDVPDNGRRALAVTIRPLDVETNAPRSALVLISDITGQRKAEFQLERTTAALQQTEAELRESESARKVLAERLIGSHEAERERVARELHDELNQRLAMLTVDAERLQVKVRQPEVKLALESLREGTRGLMTDVRRLAHQLHPSILDHLGLEVALRSYCADFSAHEGIQVKYSIRNPLGTLPPDVSLCLYRVCQESLRNIAKHSQAKRAAVTLGKAKGEVRLSIRDWGIGFDVETAIRGGGLGLLSIRERVRLVRGTVTVESSPGKGSQTTVRIPIAKGAGHE
jgi:signal transduction histidine kinase